MKSIITFASISIFATIVTSQNSTYKRGLTDHFIQFLNLNKNYYPYNFNRTQFFGGSFGGKDNDTSPITKVPVVFVHGAADMLYGDNDSNNGFRYSIEYFIQNGYTKSEIYGSMWGFGDTSNQKNLVDVISHSMGVTLSRAAIKGGEFDLEDIQIIKLNSLGSRIRTYIGIAGINYGFMVCLNETISHIRNCDKILGFYPGMLDNKTNTTIDQSKFLQQINQNKAKEGTYAYSILSLYDQVAKPYVYGGNYTSVFPTMDMAFIFNSSLYTHCQVRDLSAELQLRLLNSYHEDIKETSEMNKFI
ncbi:lipase [Stylonychia lemnae]|uniref:Lipase n=1 Tax=Stylonychia lemnae TaxID=5949 RepID=A0A078AP23_STYLE|nr:lipase [Stylonychia lemnae]|eukprot:CDW84125.1 lipase [Stylonychia lemnae]